MNEELDELVRHWTRGVSPAMALSMDPGQYAGRGPTESDLNSKMLDSIYFGVKNYQGDRAATMFVRFVNNLEDLSASAFIVAFENFWRLDCSVPTIDQDKARDNEPSGSPKAMEAQAFALIATSLTGQKKSPDEILRASKKIKAAFIEEHLLEIPETKRKDLPRSRGEFREGSYFSFDDNGKLLGVYGTSD